MYDNLKAEMLNIIDKKDKLQLNLKNINKKIT